MNPVVMDGLVIEDVRGDLLIPITHHPVNLTFSDEDASIEELCEQGFTPVAYLGNGFIADRHLNRLDRIENRVLITKDFKNYLLQTIL